MRPAIRVENVKKRYSLGSSRFGPNLTEAIASGLGRLMGRARRENRSDFWALDGVSFEVQPGEAVGIIGRNGAGKSTLLKVLSRITHPTEGRIEVCGRIGSLLEVGTGFHPELSGRENVYLNGSILGMTRREIARKFDEIVAFSGVERFLDTPVKRYSSGMFVRLAFAVAAHLEPEILVVDEVLAVGDVEFQKKCVEKMRAVSRTGRTVLLVSHNLSQIESLCSRALTLRQGRGVGFGPTDEQIRRYLADARPSQSTHIDLRDHPNRTAGSTPILTGLTLLADGVPETVVRMNGGFGCELHYRLPKRPRDLRVGVVVENNFGVRVTTFSPTYQDPHLLDDPPAEGVVRAEIPTHTLMAGTYQFNVYAQAEGTSDGVVPAGSIEVETADVFGSGRLPEPREAATYSMCKWTKSW
jgi:lipopolysaccharide transport system ATP-binding protein